MLRGLGQMMYEVRLTELGLLSPQKAKGGEVRRDLATAFICKRSMGVGRDSKAKL